MTEPPIKIEPYYQAQGKQLVDFLFDKGYFSETLSRGGMDDVEGLLALYLQLGAESAARCGAMTKKYKKITGKEQQEGEDQPRHEEEMRWIARAREAKGRVAELEEITQKFEPSWPPSWEKAPGWALEVGAFLKKTLSPPFCFEMGEASRLFTQAIELGIIPEPDCRPGQEWQVKPGDGCACPPPEFYGLITAPGKVWVWKEEVICEKCGGRKIFLNQPDAVAGCGLEEKI